MGNSLQEQLLKAGLVNKKQVKKAEHDKRVKNKKNRKTKAEPIEDAREKAQKLHAQKAERDRELNRLRSEEAKKKEVDAQINDLIRKNQLPMGQGRHCYNFIDQSKIKKIFVDKEVQDKLARGLLAIVAFGNEYALVPADIAMKVRERDDSRVVAYNDPSQQDEMDDYYAAYKIPDDLEW